MTTPQRIKDPWQRIDELERRLARLERGSKAHLSGAVIGQGGLVVQDEGSITMRDGGSLRIRDGGDIVVFYPDNTGGGVAVRIDSDAGVATIRVNTPDGREVFRTTANIFGAICSSAADQINFTADGGLAPTAQFGVAGRGNPGIFVQNGLLNLHGGNNGVTVDGIPTVSGQQPNVRIDFDGTLKRVS